MSQFLAWLVSRWAWIWFHFVVLLCAVNAVVRRSLGATPTPNKIHLSSLFFLYGHYVWNVPRTYCTIKQTLDHSKTIPSTLPKVSISSGSRKRERNFKMLQRFGLEIGSEKGNRKSWFVVFIRFEISEAFKCILLRSNMSLFQIDKSWNKTWPFFSLHLKVERSHGGMKKKTK